MMDAFLLIRFLQSLWALNFCTKIPIAECILLLDSSKMCNTFLQILAFMQYFLESTFHYFIGKEVRRRHLLVEIEGSRENCLHWFACKHFFHLGLNQFSHSIPISLPDRNHPFPLYQVWWMCSIHLFSMGKLPLHLRMWIIISAYHLDNILGLI